ncbi:hypothetical protein PVMG_05933 [Plasmodium vivax Mauritania I]|uniref:PIR Superfamily Protein n=1 Tax=Plasmodium vivax Mauritania I TaxID=1035515 RepID=A0A0J9VQL1_PLAVI|nr:hypothetical protein PVMG_05933 [Plasmodium vivax Mauritania I]
MKTQRNSYKQLKKVSKILYQFFKNIDKYLPYHQFCNKHECDQYKDKCDLVGSLIVGKKNELIDICARLHHLINQLLNSTQSQVEETHLEYLNFWLNHELHKIDDKICPDTFCQLMRARNTQNRALGKLKSHSYYINKEEVNNINLLYYIYYNYNEIEKILDNTEASQEPVNSYAKYCVEKYRELRAKCSEKDSDLCKALDVFQTKYENTNIRKEELPDWTIYRLPSLHVVEVIKSLDTGNSDNETTVLSGGSIPTKNVRQPSIILMLSEDPEGLSTGPLRTSTIKQGRVLDNLKGECYKK